MRRLFWWIAVAGWILAAAPWLFAQQPPPTANSYTILGLEGARIQDRARVEPGNVGTNRGTFHLGARVQITGSVAAVPEPSSLALLAGFAGLGCVALRRRPSARR